MASSFDDADPFWSRLVDDLASRVADRLASELGKLVDETRGPGPWLTTAEAIKYTQTGGWIVVHRPA